ncbi:ArsR/SmtB family transcription factor [Neisseria weixii]|uniref:ArsR/SmtB family transcription factor n=1 Tax=Neisseria weixii TaxID=1853276 RepID=UPI00359F8CF7
MNQEPSFEEKIVQASDLLKAVSNPHRLQILCLLAQHQELNVGQILAHSSLSQSALSQHLAKMRDEGMIGFRREGQTLFYSIADERVIRLLDTLKEMFCA